MAMEEPRAGVVSLESDSDIVTCTADVNDIADDGVDVVVSATAGTSNDVEIVTVQVEGMTTTDDTTRHAKFNDSVGRKFDNATSGEEILSILLTAQDLEENRDRGRGEGGTVDVEDTSSEVEKEVPDEVCTTSNRLTRYTRAREGVKSGLHKRRCTGALSRSRVSGRRTDISQDSRVDAIGERSSTPVGLSADPVVTYRLVCAHDKGVSLTDEDCSAVDA